MISNSRKYWAVIGIVFFALTLFALGSLFIYQNAYAGKIYKNVSIAGLDVSGKTKKQANVILTKKFDALLQKEITFTAGEKSVSAPISSTGLSFDFNKSIAQAYSVGRSNKFFPQLYASAKTSIESLNITVPVLIDNTKLSLFVSDQIPNLNLEASNAYLSIDNSGQINIVPEVVGQKVDSSLIAKELSEKIAGSGSLTIILQKTTIEPEITSGMLVRQREKAYETINSDINLIFESFSFVPSREEIAKWINFSSDINTLEPSIDNNKVKAYLTVIAKNFEVVKKDKKINYLDNSVLEEGQQGKYLDKDAALELILDALNNGSGTVALKTYTVDPKEIKVYPAEGIVPGRFEGKYVDVDLAQQRLCLIEGNNILNCFIISSGKPSMPTPTGTRYIDSKEVKRWSRTYGLWMPYWQSLGGGYGIHELPEWPGGYKEGENHLGTPVSHGCIRLGIGSAEAVYNWTDVGTPVYIHK